MMEISGFTLLFFMAVAAFWRMRIGNKGKRLDAPLSNVAQHEFMVVPIQRDAPVLRTRNVGPCTAWYGWDTKRRVAFLAHFDSPFSPRSLPYVIDALRRHVPQDAHFETRLEGGLMLTAWYSILTRRAIKKAAQAQHGLTFDFADDKNHNGWVARDISLRPLTAEVSYRRVAGAKRPKGVKWIFSPLIEVKP